MKHRRKIRHTKQTELRKVLELGQHFDSPIVVNKLNGKFRIIDGNHRIQAIKEITSEKRNPNFEIEILLVVYDNVREEDEIQLYRRWNIGTKQSTDDFIKNHEEEIDILEWLRKDFPECVSIYKTPSAFHVRLLLGSYMAAKQGRYGGYMKSNEDFVKDAKDLDKYDFEFLKQWAKEYLKVFGNPSTKENIFSKTTPFTAIMSIAYITHNKKKVWQKFKKIFGDDHIIRQTTMGGVSSTNLMVELMIDKMNRNSPEKISMSRISRNY